MNHSVEIGGSNGALSSLANGTTGQVLTAVTGADPTWAATGNVTAAVNLTDLAIVRGDGGVFGVKTSTATIGNTGNTTFNNNTSTTPLIVWGRNNDTNAASTSNIQSTVVTGSTADAYFQTAVESTRHYSTGIDNSDSQKLKINTDTTSVNPSSGTNLWSMTSGGSRIMPLQPAFYAELGSTISNVTGDGTIYEIPYASEIFDQGSNFTTGTPAFFTAPVTGIYFFNTRLSINSIDLAHTFLRYAFNASNGLRVLCNFNPGTFRDSGNNLTLSQSIIWKMSAGDTVSMEFNVSGFTKTIGIYDSSSFTGNLMC